MSLMPHLTPMEEQLLHLMYDPLQPQLPAMRNDVTLKDLGQKKYGEDWGGSLRGALHPEAPGTYPTIARFLGRLRKKGLVQPESSGQGWSYWSLSSDARILLGLPPASSLG